MRLTRLAITSIVFAGALTACDSATEPGLTRSAGVAFAKGGNSDAARACQNGGYAGLQGADGTAFKNVGDCVSHAAKGGAIIPIGPRIIEIDSHEIDCTALPWTVTVFMTYSGGTGTVNGQPITSGADLTIEQSPDRQYEFIVTNGTTSVSETRMFACT